MIDLLSAKRACTPMGNRLRINSSKSSAGGQTTVDGRITAGNDSVAISLANSQNNTVNATTTDFGAVSSSLNLALKGVESMTDVAKTTVGAATRANDQAGSILSGAIQSMSSQQKQFTAALENIKAGDARPLMYVSIGAVALVAVFMFASRKG